MSDKAEDVIRITENLATAFTGERLQRGQVARCLNTNDPILSDQLFWRNADGTYQPYELLTKAEVSAFSSKGDEGSLNVAGATAGSWKDSGINANELATLGQVNLQEATTGTKGSTTNEVTFNGSSKTLQTEMITGWRKSATEFWGTVRGDGILRFLKAIVSDFTAGIVTVANSFYSVGKSIFGSGSVDHGATVDIQDVITGVGYLATTAPNVPQFTGLYVQIANQNGYPAYRIGATSAYIYRGDVTSVGTYWFMDSQLRTGDDAWVNALFMHSHKNASSPEDRSFLGRNAQTGTLANVTWEAGASALGLSVGTMKVRTAVEVPNATQVNHALNQTSSLTISDFSAGTVVTGDTVSRALGKLQGTFNNERTWQSSVVSTGGIAFDVANGANLRLTTQITGAVTITISNNQVGLVNKIVFGQNATTAQAVTIAKSGITFILAGATSASNSINLANINGLGVSYIVTLEWINSTTCIICKGVN